jgi:surface antigen
MRLRRRFALVALPLAGATTLALPPAVATGHSSVLTAAHRCASGPVVSTVPSVLNRTPHAPNPWTVPIDPCNSEAMPGAKHPPYSNCAYWAAEKRPDLWRHAVLRYGYTHVGGGWDIEIDARRAGYHIGHRPKAGDIAAWRPNARMGGEGHGIVAYASPGGHVAYVEKVLSHHRIKISEMGITSSGGYTKRLRYSKHTYFIHRGRSV